MLEPIMGSAVKERILLFILTHSNAYAREISGVMDMNYYTVQRFLHQLEADGILYSRLRGKIRLFEFNPRYTFLPELKALLEKVLKYLPEEEVENYYKPRLRPRKSGKDLRYDRS
ncbi:MAG: hypothetical protein PHT33_02455 [bacterium]|nr:hypothetical protein [bacterium]